MADMIDDLIQKIIEKRKSKNNPPPIPNASGSENMPPPAPPHNNIPTAVQGIVQVNPMPPEPPLHEQSSSAPIIAEIIQNIISQTSNTQQMKPLDKPAPNDLISNIIQSIISQISTPKTILLNTEAKPIERPAYPPVEASIIEGLIKPKTNMPFRTNTTFTIKKPNKSNIVPSIIEGIVNVKPDPIPDENKENDMGKDNTTQNIIASIIEGIVQPKPKVGDEGIVDTNATPEKKDNGIDTGSSIIESPNNIITVSTNPDTATTNTETPNAENVISDDNFMKIEKTFQKLQNA